jgi:phosphotransferase system HPr (HPr) family protein
MRGGLGIAPAGARRNPRRSVNPARFEMNKVRRRASNEGMKQASVTVPWREGLHLRYAVKLVQAAKGFRSSISLEVDGRVADLRSILSVLALCATMGDDEQAATHSIERIFQP